MKPTSEFHQRIETFLNQPTVKSIDYETKKKFLLQKGVTEEEISHFLPTEIIEYSPFWKRFGYFLGISGTCIGFFYLFKNYIIPWWKKKYSQKSKRTQSSYSKK